MKTVSLKLFITNSKDALVQWSLEDPRSPFLLSATSLVLSIHWTCSPGFWLIRLALVSQSCRERRNVCIDWESENHEAWRGLKLVTLSPHLLPPTDSPYTLPAAWSQWEELFWMCASAHWSTRCLVVADLGLSITYRRSKMSHCSWRRLNRRCLQSRVWASISEELRIFDVWRPFPVHYMYSCNSICIHTIRLAYLHLWHWSSFGPQQRPLQERWHFRPAHKFTREQVVGIWENPGACVPSVTKKAEVLFMRYETLSLQARFKLILFYVVITIRLVRLNVNAKKQTVLGD